MDEELEILVLVCWLLACFFFCLIKAFLKHYIVLMHLCGFFSVVLVSHHLHVSFLLFVFLKFNFGFPVHKFFRTLIFFFPEFFALLYIYVCPSPARGNITSLIQNG